MDTPHCQLSYGTARRAVGEWYLHAGRAGLARLIMEVKGGKDFDSVFNTIASIERAHLTRHSTRTPQKRGAG